MRWDYWPMPFFFGPLFMIAIFVICMIMMMWTMRGHCHDGGSRALDILKERYARGRLIKPNTKSGGACCAHENSAVCQR